MGFKMPKIRISNIASGGLNLPQVGNFARGNAGFIKDMGSGNVQGAMDNFQSSFGLGGKNPTPPGGGEDPTVSALRGRLFGEAQDFEKNLSGYQQQASDQIGKEGDLALQSGLKGTRQNFNRRGLLYSGLREGGEQDVRGKVASGMAGQKAQSNQDLNKMAQAKWAKAGQVGLQGYQDAVNREAEIAGINLQNQVARAQAMQQLGQVGGYAAGSMYANRDVSAPNTGAAGYSSSYNPYGNQPRAVPGGY